MRMTRACSAAIFEGGVSFIDRPFYLTLKTDSKYARVASAVADRINVMFQDDPRRLRHVAENKRYLVNDEITSQINDTLRSPTLGKGEVAKAINKDAIFVKLPYEYRLNPERLPARRPAHSAARVDRDAGPLPQTTA